MQHTSERELIESIAQARVKYENIMNDQHTELRTDPQRLDAAVTKLNETPLIAELGQNWVPAEDMVDDYLAKCDGLCQIIPETFDDRVKVLHGAHAGLMVVIACKLGKQSERVQLEIIRRYTEIAQRPYVPNVPGLDPPISTTFNDIRPVTTSDMEQFQNPDDLLGKQFRHR